MSKIRIIWKQGGAVFYGHRALRQLYAIASANYVTIPLTTGPRWRQAINAEQVLRVSRTIGPSDGLMIYREPRRVGTSRSRYRQSLRTLGVPADTPPRRPRRPTPAPLRGGGHPKPKRASRTVAMLEAELLRRVEDF